LDLIDKEDFDLALLDCKKAIELAPESGNPYIIRARIYLLANDYDKAWADVHKAEEFGAKVNPQFIDQLKEASGREK
jgi:tetratricopeptide (TPR) repeat protein